MGFNDDWYMPSEIEWAAGEPDWDEGDPDWIEDDPDWIEDDPDWIEDQQEVELTFDILVHTTKKAYLLQFGERDVWFPKGQAVINMSMHKNTVLVPRWLMKEKGLEEYSTGRFIEATKVEKLFDRVVRKHIKGLEEDIPFSQK